MYVLMYVCHMSLWVDGLGWMIIEMPWCVTPQDDIDLHPLLFLFKAKIYKFTCSSFLYARQIVDIYRYKVHKYTYIYIFIFTYLFMKSHK